MCGLFNELICGLFIADKIQWNITTTNLMCESMFNNQLL